MKLQEKVGRYKQFNAEIYKVKWEKIKKVLSEGPTAHELKTYLGSVGIKMNMVSNIYSDQKIQDAIWYAKDLKDRYSVLWLHYFMFYF